MYIILSQIFGIIALILVCFGYFTRQKGTFLIFQIVANIFYAAAFFFANSIVAAVITLISILRCVHLYICDIKNFKYTNYTLVLYIAAYSLTATFLWTSWLDIIPVITATIFTISFSVKDLQIMRYIVLLPNLILTAYGIIYQSYSTAILDFIEFCVVVVAIIKFHKERNFEKWFKENTQSLQDKTVAITGSTGGLGKQICMHLAKLNANLLFLNRNKTKSETFKSQILEKHPNTKIDFVQVDMQDVDSVKSACETLKKIDIDILILNAGALNLSRQKSSLGYDNVFQVNFVSPYFFTKQLLPQLKQKKDSKIVAVGSIAHKYATLNEKDIDYTNETNGQKVYGNSKRFLMYSLYELFKKETKVKLSVVHPGITQTNITSNYPKILQPIIKLSMKLIYSSPKKAALSIINGIFTNTEHSTWIGPKFKNIWGYPKKSNLKSCSPEESQKIYSIAENIYKSMTKKQSKSAKTNQNNK